tara:strand:+ start:3974 stop:4363 length:390 start_codon:yes stop_codon:yes gene_type:complete
MRIIKEAQTVRSEEYLRRFDFADSPGSGLSFTCNAKGRPLIHRLNESSRKTLRECLAGEVDGRKMIDRGVRDYSKDVREPAEGICDVCRATVVLANTWASPCECGTEYNGSGQRLAPRSQWGEETGETF